MAITKASFNTSIGRKVLMALSGLGFVGFIIGHVSGNLLIFNNDGGEAFNEYAHFMKTTPIIWVAEIVIFTLILVHIIDGIVLTIQNRKARPVPYASKKKSSDASLSSRYMSFLGGTLLIFFILHLADFFFPSKITGSEFGDDLYAMVVAKFQNLGYVIFYVLCMVALGLHLAHGVASAFQTMGWKHPKIYKPAKAIGYLLAIAVPLLFASVPVFIYLTK